METNCLACDVISGKVIPPGGTVFENDYIFISHAIPPCQHKGFMIVEPKRHCEHVVELTEEEMQELIKGIHLTSKAITKVLKPKKIYVCSFGETVKHVHFYVIPRYEEMPASGIAVLTQILKEKKWSCSDEEAEKASNKIKKELLQLSF